MTIFSGPNSVTITEHPCTDELDTSGGLCTGPVDLTKERGWNATDAAMSIEVAEHIPAQFEANFVNNLGTVETAYKVTGYKVK